jgi:hypothetical protein
MNQPVSRIARVKLDLQETGCAAADAHIKKLAETLCESAERAAREYESSASSHGIVNRLRMHTLRFTMRVSPVTSGGRLTLNISAAMRCGDRCETVEFTEVWDAAAGKMISLRKSGSGNMYKT